MVKLIMLSTQQSTVVKNVKIVEFHDLIWNRHEKYFEISTNIPVMCSLIHEIAVNISEMWESQNNFAQ